MGKYSKIFALLFIGLSLLAISFFWIRFERTKQADVNMLSGIGNQLLESANGEIGHYTVGADRSSLYSELDYKKIPDDFTRKIVIVNFVEQGSNIYALNVRKDAYKKLEGRYFALFGRDELPLMWANRSALGVDYYICWSLYGGFTLSKKEIDEYEGWLQRVENEQSPQTAEP